MKTWWILYCAMQAIPPETAQPSVSFDTQEQCQDVSNSFQELHCVCASKVIEWPFETLIEPGLPKLGDVSLWKSPPRAYLGPPAPSPTYTLPEASQTESRSLRRDNSTVLFPLSENRRDNTTVLFPLSENRPPLLPEKLL